MTRLPFRVLHTYLDWLLGDYVEAVASGHIELFIAHAFMQETFTSVAKAEVVYSPSCSVIKLLCLVDHRLIIHSIQSVKTPMRDPQQYTTPNFASTK